MKTIKLIPLFLLSFLHVYGMEKTDKKQSNFTRANSSPSILQKSTSERDLRDKLLDVRAQEVTLKRQEFSFKKEEFEWKKSIINLVKEQLANGADVSCKIDDSEIYIHVMQKIDIDK